MLHAVGDNCGASACLFTNEGTGGGAYTLNQLNSFGETDEKSIIMGLLSFNTFDSCNTIFSTASYRVETN